MAKKRDKQKSKKPPAVLQEGIVTPSMRSTTSEVSEQPTPSYEKTKRSESLKILREVVVACTAVMALVVSIKSCRTSTTSLKLSQQQAEMNRRYHQEHVKPDVHTVIRHSSSSRDITNQQFMAELVVWNNGPIKAVSLTGAYRAYALEPTNYHVYFSMGISEPLVDYSFSLPEFKTKDEFVRPILSLSSPALYVVNLTYYRETDMEQYSKEDYFLFENGVFYDRESFRSKTNYGAIMESLLLKMKCEAQSGAIPPRIIDPPAPGASAVYGNVLNVPDVNSPEWGPIISNWTAKVAADSKNAEVYTMRGLSFHLMHKSKEAVSDYQQAVKLGSTNFWCYNNLANIQSTSTNAVLRNGRNAVVLAKQACAMTNWKDWGCISTLAAAYAEVGNFTLAIQYEQQALDMTGMLPLQREVEERALARMQNHLPLREDVIWQ